MSILHKDIFYCSPLTQLCVMIFMNISFMYQTAWEKIGESY